MKIGGSKEKYVTKRLAGNISQIERIKLSQEPRTVCFKSSLIMKRARKVSSKMLGEVSPLL